MFVVSLYAFLLITFTSCGAVKTDPVTSQDAKEADEDKASEDRERSLLERDLEEASTRLNMAHEEIRRLTDELESAHLTNSTYSKGFRDIHVYVCVFSRNTYTQERNPFPSESELHGAQVEAEQLRHEVEMLKRCGSTSSIVLLRFI